MTVQNHVGLVCSLISRPFPTSHCQYFLASSMKYGGGRPGDLVMCGAIRLTYGRHTEGGAQ